MRRATAAGLSALVAFGAVAQEPYVDRVLDEGPQPQLKLETELDTTGWRRGWRVEFSRAVDSGTLRAGTAGLGLSGFIDTPAWGSVSLSANLVSIEGGSSTSLWRIDQAALPLDGGWRADHSAGALATAMLPLTRAGGRITLPANPIEGATASYTRTDATHIVASVGKPGLYSGASVNGFTLGPGALASAGLQGSSAVVGGELQTGVQYAGARAIQAPNAPLGSLESNDAVWTGLRWRGNAPWAAPSRAGRANAWRLRDGELEVSTNLLASRVRPANSAGGSSVAAWSDARWRSGVLEQGTGIFYLPTRTRWGAYSAVPDLQGGYWRGDWTQRQWQLGAYVEWTESISGSGLGSALTSISASRRLDSRTSLSGVASVRRKGNPGESVSLAWDRRTNVALVQWRLDALRTIGHSGRRLGVDVNLPDVFSFGTVGFSTFLEKDTNFGVPTRQVGWGLLASIRPATGIQIDANLRGLIGSDGSRQANGNLSVGWTLAPRWTILAQYTVNRGVGPQPLTLISALSSYTQLQPTLRYERVQLTLRYQEQAGTTFAPIGGAPGSGAGWRVGVLRRERQRPTRSAGSRSARDLRAP